MSLSARPLPKRVAAYNKRHRCTVAQPLADLTNWPTPRVCAFAGCINPGTERQVDGVFLCLSCVDVCRDWLAKEARDEAEWWGW